MLSLHHVHLTLPQRGEALQLLQDISWWAPAGHLMAVVGPSGCGKSTMLKVVAGILHETDGEVCWRGKALSAGGELKAAELGYVPQFSIAYDHLTVEESIEAATRLRVAGDYDDRWDRIESVMKLTGMEAIADRPVKVLSGGQKRRLGLAMELVSDPALLLCDEVTSGLDPRSEEEIVELLHRLARERQRLVLTVTHSLAHLSLYDSVLVLFAGCVAYHGPPASMTHYFGVEHPEDIYPALAHREPQGWASSWLKHRGAYYRKLLSREDQARFAVLDDRIARGELPAALPVDDDDATAESAPAAAPGLPASAETPPSAPAPPVARTDSPHDERREVPAPVASADEAAIPPQPGFASQLLLTFGRRWKIFFRDRVTLLLHLAILIGFPALVAAFGAEQQGAVRGLGDAIGSDIRQEVESQMRFNADMAKVGGRVSGLIMFQVVLLTLMAANNAAREVAGERDILEKEKLGGLSPQAYLAGRLGFLVVLVLLQSLWMAGFVQLFWPFPGSAFHQHVLLLLLVNGAITALCLGISAMLDNPDQANLLSIYLVGFQLPLSGAILALPGWLQPVAQPLISAYWAWSGSISSLEGIERAAVLSVAPTQPAAFNTAVLVLLLQLGVGLVVATIGIRQRRWRQ